jgi:hypothetical protein
LEFLLSFQVLGPFCPQKKYSCKKGGRIYFLKNYNSPTIEILGKKRKKTKKVKLSLTQPKLELA